jgi:hypothetical protein
MLAGCCQHIVVTSEHLYVGDYTGGDPSGHQATSLQHRPAASRQSDLQSVPVIQATPGMGAAQSSSGACQAFDSKLSNDSARNGFLLDYVIHVQSGVGGPHAIEVKLSNVNVYWPFLLNLKLVQDVIQVYSHFARMDMALPNHQCARSGHPEHCVHGSPQLPCIQNSRWMCVNAVMTHGQLLLVSPTPVVLDPAAAHASTWLPAVALRWDLLRVGYDWGAVQESVLHATLQRLSASLVKSIDLSRIEREWDHREGLVLEKNKSELLRPASGTIRWQAARPPGPHTAESGQATLEQPSITGSSTSRFSMSPSLVSNTSRLTSQHGGGDASVLWTTSHMHTLTVELDTLRPQIVLSSRWYLHALLNALQGAGQAQDTKAGQSAANKSPACSTGAASLRSGHADSWSQLLGSETIVALPSAGWAARRIAAEVTENWPSTHGLGVGQGRTSTKVILMPHAVAGLDGYASAGTRPSLLSATDPCAAAGLDSLCVPASA